jgi:hypothetical protein
MLKANTKLSRRLHIVHGLTSLSDATRVKYDHENYSLSLPATKGINRTKFPFLQETDQAKIGPAA